MTITPNANTIIPTTTGRVIIRVLADAVEDAAGNGNAASAPYTVKVDVDRPTVTITSPSGPGPYNDTFEVDFTFSESVTGFVVGDDIELDPDLRRLPGSQGVMATLPIR